jgi:8-oxo-dGTP pyrophosphatase MutT (NUDIX family)
MNKNLKAYECRSSREVYRNPWIRVTEDKVVRPNGKDGIFGVVHMRPGSTIIALTVREEVYLVREYKYALGTVSLEAVSGGLDGEETPLEGAKREMQEELGIVAETWTDLGVLHPFTTIIDSPNHMFLAEGLTIGADNPDEGEELAVEIVPFTIALQWVMDGTIIHGASCTAILKVAQILLERSGGKG